MKTTFAALLLLTAAFPCALSGSDEPFAGKWKLNQAKSKFTGVTSLVAAAGPNTWKFTFGDMSWTVKADGTDQPTAFGTVALTFEGPDRWKLVTKTKGKLYATQIWTLAPDGNTMTRVTTGMRQNGDHWKDTVDVTRVGGGKGFEGMWQSTKVNQSSPAEVDVEPAANGDLAIRMPSGDVQYTVKFDGTECPVSGPSVPPGMTVSATRSGPRAAHATTKINGKVLDTEEWTVSADGKTFTLVEHDPGQPQALVAIYDRM